jgi:hypothetical protein
MITDPSLLSSPRENFFYRLKRNLISSAFTAALVGELMFVAAAGKINEQLKMNAVAVEEWKQCAMLVRQNLASETNQDRLLLSAPACPLKRITVDGENFVVGFTSHRQRIADGQWIWDYSAENISVRATVLREDDYLDVKRWKNQKDSPIAQNIRFYDDLGDKTLLAGAGIRHLLGIGSNNPLFSFWATSDVYSESAHTNRDSVYALSSTMGKAWTITAGHQQDVEIKFLPPPPNASPPRRARVLQKRPG